MLLLEKEATQTIHRDNYPKEKACNKAHHFVWEHFFSSFGTVKGFRAFTEISIFGNFGRNENPNENLRIWKT